MPGPLEERGAGRVLANFLAPDGTLRSIPVKRSKRLVLLDHLAQQFELGQTYTETQVDVVLMQFHPDHAALRRHLVDEDFMTRDAGVYWRSGGTVVV